MPARVEKMRQTKHLVLPLIHLHPSVILAARGRFGPSAAGIQRENRPKDAKYRASLFLALDPRPARA
jgi:hypothetical protein